MRKVVKKYLDVADKYKKDILGYIANDVSVVPNKADPLGNIFTDTINEVTHSDVSFVNQGMLR